MTSVLELVLGQSEEWKNKRGEEWRNKCKTDEKEWINMFLAQMNYNYAYKCSKIIMHFSTFRIKSI